jgi:hypothetical protein
MHRVSFWLFALSVGLGAIAASGGAGCSSSSSPATQPDASSDTGTEPSSDASGVMTCRVDASLTVFAQSDASAAGCAACVNVNCMTAINACASDCTCINLFECLADSGVATTGLNRLGDALRSCSGGSGTALLQNPGIRSLGDCLQNTCAPACGDILDASADDAALADDAAITADAGTAITDAGAPADGDDGG